MRILALTLTALLLLLANPFTASAEDASMSPEEAEKAAQAQAAQLSDSIRELVNELDEPNKRHFFLLYNNHNIISTVKTVRADVGKAIESCEEKNPELSPTMTKRYNTWKSAVNEKLSDAQAYIDNMVKVQEYAKEEQITDILKLADTLRSTTAMKVQKVPVTTKESCEFLLAKMDETQDTMTALLEKTLISGSSLIEAMPVEETTDQTE